MAPSAPRPPARPPAQRPHGRPPSWSPGLGPWTRPWAVPLVLLGLLLLTEELAAQSTCGPGLITPGVTIPQGDIILQEGELLELYCVLNLTHPSIKGRNASHLVFIANNQTIGREYLHVMNETTVMLSMRPDVSSSMYYCKLDKFEDADEEVVCLNNVAVGYPPVDVTDFSCVSQNWQNLTCTWKKNPNPVKTMYSIWYRLPGRAGGRTKFACPDDSDVQDDKCVWNETSNPPYRLPYDTYFFIIEGSNHFNNSSFIHKYNHYAHVIPAKPDKLKKKELTAYSVCLEWAVPYPMQNFPPGLIQRVEYLPQWESRESWHSVDTSQLNHKQTKHELNITSLKYANTLYDIRVYLKSVKAASNDDSLWSAPAAITIKTKPDLPGAPPKTDLGSFEVFNHVDSRDVYIYWQTIPDYLRNGDDFSYKIVDVEENGVRVSRDTTELNKKYARYSKVDLNKSFRLRIVSVNTEGQSLNKSEITIPPHHQIPPGPASVTKVFYENGTYELSWKPPATEKGNIQSYTIFWCDSIYDHMCSGYLNWTHVPSNVTIKNMTVEDDKPYQFAVSANTFNASSGMVWASCTILYNKPIQKMKNVWVKKVGSTFMELVWNLDCLDWNGLVSGFRIYYCPVQHKGPECKSPNQNVTVHNPQESSANLTGLRPYTTYSISVAVLSNGGESLPSDPLFNVTLEAAPSPPTNVSIVNITNTTITVTWNVPEEKNGVITKYEVHYDGKVQTKNNDNQKKQEVVLDNLTSHYNYSISVAACTFACSDKSPPLIAETKVGEPGMVTPPHVTFLNESLLSVKWDAPARPSGLLDVYQVIIIYPDNTTEPRTLNTTETYLTIPIEGCKENNHPYSISVRAVNIDRNTGKEFAGQWSLPGESSCYTNDIPQYLKIIIYFVAIFFVGFISCGLICVGKKVWFKCKDMRDVEVKLPPGIVLPMESDRDQDFKMHHWVNHNHDPQPPHGLCPAADEERLLQQKDDHHHDRNLSGDSSGCSSGHESVSSSATEGTHISSDSGTEVDRTEAGFGDPSWEAGSDSTSVGKRQAGKGSTPWDEPYACVGGQGGQGRGVRSTPNLTELDPGYTVLSLASWPSSSSIPDQARTQAGPDKPNTNVQLGHVTCNVQGPQLSRGYVTLDAASGLPKGLHKGLPPAKQGYVPHPPTSLLWEHPGSGHGDNGRTSTAASAPVPVPKGYVQTGARNNKESQPQAFTPECEGSWDEPFRLQQANSGGYVKAGECNGVPAGMGVGIRPSRTDPVLAGVRPSATGASGYVMTGESGLPRLKPDAAPAPAPATAQGPGKQPHEYVLTGERDVTAGRPLVTLDSQTQPQPQSKSYCRVSDRDRDTRPRPIPVAVPVVPTVVPAVVPMAVQVPVPIPASSGYVPHRQMEAAARTAPSVAE